MLRYSSSTHQKLMHESEYALHAAARSARKDVSRIANTIIRDNRFYRQWETTHADLLLPVAQRRKNSAQLMELRNAEIRLIHRRALFDYLKQSGLRGERRKRLFRVIHTTRDFEDAVLAEHRQFMLAVSSHVSADHLIDVMEDVSSQHLLQMYETSYASYFEMRCFIATATDSTTVDLVRLSMKDIGKQLQRIRMRLQTEIPVTYGGDFERQEALARSGRYPILDYMVG